MCVCVLTRVSRIIIAAHRELLSVNDTVKFMFIVQIAMHHYDMYVKVAYDNFNNKRRYDVMMMMM